MGFHLFEIPKVVKFIETETTMVTRVWGDQRMRSYCLIGTVSVSDNEKVLELDGGKFI